MSMLNSKVEVSSLRHGQHSIPHLTLHSLLAAVGIGDVVHYVMGVVTWFTATTNQMHSALRSAFYFPHSAFYQHPYLPQLQCGFREAATLVSFTYFPRQYLPPHQHRAMSILYLTLVVVYNLLVTLVTQLSTTAQLTKPAQSLGYLTQTLTLTLLTLVTLTVSITLQHLEQRYGIVVFNVSLDTSQVISETILRVR